MQGEKNKILENLAAMSEKKDTSTALAWTYGTKLTLEGLINQHKDSTDQRDGSQLNKLYLPNTEADESPSNNDDSFEPIRDEDFGSVPFGLMERGALSVSSDGESPENSPEETKEIVARASENDEDDEFEPLAVINASDSDQACCASDQNANHTVSAANSAVVLPNVLEEARQSDEEGNFLLKLGGSLAVVGAVVGSVALAAAQNNGGEDSNRQNRKEDKRERKKKR